MFRNNADIVDDEKKNNCLEWTKCTKHNKKRYTQYTLSEKEVAPDVGQDAMQLMLHYNMTLSCYHNSFMLLSVQHYISYQGWTCFHARITSQDTAQHGNKKYNGQNAFYPDIRKDS